MGIVIMASGTPETAWTALKLGEALSGAIGRTFDLENAAAEKADTIVLCIHAIAPFRGTIPNGTRHKRAHSEFWSSYNIDFESFLAGGVREKLEAIGAALVSAIHQVPANRMSAEEKRQFEAAISTATQYLLADPSRTRFPPALGDS